MLGGAWFEELFGPVGEAQTSVVTEVALRTLQEHLGISQSPSFLRAEIHKVCSTLAATAPFPPCTLSQDMVRPQLWCIFSLSQNCIPQYTLGHASRVGE